MLLPTHYKIFITALLKIGFKLEGDSLKFNNIIFKDEDFKKISKGLFFPDLPCAYFYIDKNGIDMMIKLCSITKLAFLGKMTNTYVSSQLEESHNGYYSINHSMASNMDDTNEITRMEIIKRCCILAYKYLESHDYTFLGYLLHIIQDSYSPGHTYRVPLTEPKKNISMDYKNIITQLKTIKNIQNFKIDDKINASTVTKLVYKMLSQEKNINSIMEIVNKMSNNNENDKENVDYSEIMNLIVKLILEEITKNDEKIQIAKILLNDNTKIINDYFIIKKKLSSNIDYVLLIDKISTTNTKIFKDIIIYSKFPHNLTRLYKLVMNSMYTQINLKKMENLQNGGSDNITDKNYYIKLFLFYPKQDAGKHGIKDCYGILKTKYNESQLYKSAVNDTIEILKIMLINPVENIITTIEKLFNHLINHTYYIDEKYLQFDPKKIDEFAYDITKIDDQLKPTMQEFVTCTKENINLSTNINFGIKQTKDFINNIEKQNDLNGGNIYQYKYNKYLSKNNKLNNIII